MSTAGPLAPQDRAAIEDLVLAYGELVDEGRLDELALLFTDDAVLDYGHGRLCHGREEVVVFVAGRAGRYRATSHHLSNVRTTPDGDGAARVRTYVYAWHERPDGDQVEVWGRYLDRVTRTPEGWRIAERAIRAAGYRGFTLDPGAPPPFEHVHRKELP